MKKMFAHRYKWSHEKRRKKLRRLEKDGKIKLIEATSEGFFYEVPDALLIPLR